MMTNILTVKQASRNHTKKVTYDWLSLDGQEWIPSEGTIDGNTLVSMEKGTIKNVRLASKETILTLEIMDSFGFDKRTDKPDWDDVCNYYKLPNGIEVQMYTVMLNQPADCDYVTFELGELGEIEIDTKEQLERFAKKSYEQIIEDILS